MIQVIISVQIYLDCINNLSDNKWMMPLSHKNSHSHGMFSFMVSGIPEAIFLDLTHTGRTKIHVIWTINSLNVQKFLAPVQMHILDNFHFCVF